MPEDAVGKFKEFAGHGLFHAVDAGDAVTDREHGTSLRDLDLFVVVLDLLPDDLTDLFSSDLH